MQLYTGKQTGKKCAKWNYTYEYIYYKEYQAFVLRLQPLYMLH